MTPQQQHIIHLIRVWIWPITIYLCGMIISPSEKWWQKPLWLYYFARWCIRITFYRDKWQIDWRE